MKNLTTILITVLLLGISKQSHSPKYEQGIGNYVEHVCHKDNENTTYIPYNPNDKVIIIGLNNVTLDKLYAAEKIVKNFFHFKTEVKTSNMTIENQFYINNGMSVDCDKFVRYYTCDYRVIFLTNKDMWAQSVPVRGYTTLGGKIIISTSSNNMKETIIHEIGHTYGLTHCSLMSCVMAVNNDDYDSGTFCENCSRYINFNN